MENSYEPQEEQTERRSHLEQLCFQRALLLACFLPGNLCQVPDNLESFVLLFPLQNPSAEHALNPKHSLLWEFAAQQIPAVMKTHHGRKRKGCWLNGVSCSLCRPLDRSSSRIGKEGRVFFLSGSAI